MSLPTGFTQYFLWYNFQNELSAFPMLHTLGLVQALTYCILSYNKNPATSRGAVVMIRYYIMVHLSECMVGFTCSSCTISQSTSKKKKCNDFCPRQNLLCPNIYNFVNVIFNALYIYLYTLLRHLTYPKGVHVRWGRKKNMLCGSHEHHDSATAFCLNWAEEQFGTDSDSESTY